MATVLQVLQSAAPEGLLANDIQGKIPELSLESIMETLNSLLQQQHVTVTYRGTDLVFRASAQIVAPSIMGQLTLEENIIYRLIEQANDKGIWSGDLKYKSNVPPQVMTKCLKSLEKKRLIKSVKSVAQKTKKLYMLSNIEPSKLVTGGAFYTDSQLDTEFVDALCTHTLDFIQHKKYATLQDIHMFIRDRKVATVELAAEEVQLIVNVLVYDAKVEMVVQNNDQIFYRKAKLDAAENYFNEIPCGKCPVFKECSDDGVINPHTCDFFRRWLDS